MLCTCVKTIRIVQVDVKIFRKAQKSEITVKNTFDQEFALELLTELPKFVSFCLTKHNEIPLSRTWPRG